MNFVADEGIDQPIVKRPRQDGHAVWYIAEMSPSIQELRHAFTVVTPTKIRIRSAK
jgi:hypothetical protein